MSAAAEQRGPLAAIGAVSAVALAFLVWLIYFNQTQVFDPAAVAFLPAVNAALNAASAVCLVLGLVAIRAQARARHQRLMLAAFGFSALFLVSYLVYHAAHGDTKFMGTGAIRPVYFFILISHIGLSAVALPMILTTFWLSLSGRLAAHRRLARFTFPVWLYVSVTGVAIFALLKLFG
jgi:putative membrane protein